MKETGGAGNGKRPQPDLRRRAGKRMERGDLEIARMPSDDVKALIHELEMRVEERTAELLRTNERLKEEIRDRARSEEALRLEEARLEALLRLSQIGESTAPELAEFTLERAIALTQSNIGFLGFLSEDETIYTLHAVSRNMVKKCNVTGEPVQWHIAEAGLWADAIRQRKTMFVNDYSEPIPGKKGLPAGHPPVERFIVVPVSESGRIVAVAGVANKGSDYDKSDERQVALLLSGMWSYLQRDLSRKALQEAYKGLEKEVEQRTAELSESNAALQREIAERKQAEEALRGSEANLRKLTDELDTRVRERTAELEKVNRELADEIEQRLLAERGLLASQKRLAEEKEKLEQKNVALREVLDHVETEKLKIRDEVAAHIEKSVLPVLDRLVEDRDNPSLMAMLRRSLEDVLRSRLGRRIAAGTTEKLTATEEQICRLVRRGMSSREISQILKCSLKTVETHRKNIRRKLGIMEKGVNLAAYLNANDKASYPLELHTFRTSGSKAPKPSNSRNST